MRVRKHLTAAGHSLTPEPSTPCRDEQSLPATRYSKGEAEQSPGAALQGYPGQEAEHAPVLPAATEGTRHVLGGPTGPRWAPPARLSAAVPEMGRPPAAPCPDRSRGLSRPPGSPQKTSAHLRAGVAPAGSADSRARGGGRQVAPAQSLPAADGAAGQRRPPLPFPARCLPPAAGAPGRSGSRARVRAGNL